MSVCRTHRRLHFCLSRLRLDDATFPKTQPRPHVTNFCDNYFVNFPKLASTTANTTPEPAAPEVEEESAPAPTEKHTPTAASTLQSLITSGAIPDPTQLAIFKSPNAHSSTPRPAPTPDTELAPPSQKLHITPEDRAALLSGKPVRKGEGPTRVLLTPNGDYVKNLTEEEEERYLQLQESLAKQSGATTFVGGKQGMGNNGFSLIGGRAVPNGPPSFFPSPTSTLDPVSKIQRDEALSYINQYVLPSLSTNSQLEKALNANANMLDVPAWGTGGSGESSGEFLEIGVNESGNGMSWNGVSLLGFGEAEQALGMARKETEGIEKKLASNTRSSPSTESRDFGKVGFQQKAFREPATYKRTILKNGLRQRFKTFLP